LDADELAAIRLAWVLRCRLLMDERLGRQAAWRQGRMVVGSAGLLIDVNRRGLIPSITPILNNWRHSNFFPSFAIVEAVLKRAGDT
jgi:predicted nucleic acid-binding protein